MVGFRVLYPIATISFCGFWKRLDARRNFDREAASARDGFVVVAALWMLAALATLTVVASVYISRSAVALGAIDDGLRSDMLVTAGLELTAYQLSAAEVSRRNTRGSFRFRLARSEVTVEFLSEAARINLNMAPKAMIAGLFVALGAPADAADEYADRIVGWRTAPKSNGPDEEDGLYRTAGLSYFPRRAPFNSSDELWLVQGLPPALVERALSFVTVYSGMAEVNVLDAPAEVIAALPGMTPGRLDAFLKERDSLPPDPQFILGALGGDQAGATVKGSDAFRVRLHIVFSDRAGKTYEGVILVSTPSDQEAYRVLWWRDEIDPGTGAPRPPQEGR
jgi:general secretion pathway protein K